MSTTPTLVSKPAPEMTVVVLSFNRREFTKRTIDALNRVQSGVCHELIVVDNGSATEVVQMLTAFEREGLIDKLILLPENLGTSPGFNTGFRAAHPNAQFFTKLDNDIEVLSDGWLAAIRAVYEEIDNAGIVATDIINHSELQKIPVQTLPSGKQIKSWEHWRAGGGGMTIARRVFESLGPFSERFPGGLKLMPDDAEYYERAKRNGLGSYYACAAQSRMQHQHDEDHSGYHDFKRRQYQLLRTRFFFFFKRDGYYAPFIATITTTVSHDETGPLIELEVEIQLCRAERVGLGMSMQAHADQRMCNDSANDVLIYLRAGNQKVIRAFRLPADSPTGAYTISLGLYAGHAGKSANLDFVKVKEELTI